MMRISRTVVVGELRDHDSGLDVLDSGDWSSSTGGEVTHSWEAVKYAAVR